MLHCVCGLPVEVGPCAHLEVAGLDVGAQRGGIRLAGGSQRTALPLKDARCRLPLARTLRLHLLQRRKGMRGNEE